MAIREKVSDILDVTIREGRWVTYTEGLDREGKLDRKALLLIIMSLCEEVEKLENAMAGLNGKMNAFIAESEGKKAEMPPKTADNVVNVDVFTKEKEAAYQTTTGFPCPHCGKVLKTEFGLKGHLTSHKGF